VMENGGLVFAAAGNCGCLLSTRDNPYIVSVSSTTPSDAIASSSSYGDYVDVSAPGVGIYTTIRGGGYRYASGTSHASAVAASVAALVFSVDPTLRPEEVEDILERSAVDLGTAGFDRKFGYGRVDAYQAVLAAAGAPGIPPEPDPDLTVPDAWIDTPDAGAVVSGTADVVATAVDDVGVARVDLLVGGNLIGSDSVAPYAFAWNTLAVPDGEQWLEVVAYDAAGNSGRSPAVTVTVANASPDQSPPDVAIVSPSDGASLRGSLKIDVLVSDDRGPSTVELFFDDRLIGSKACGAASCSLRFRFKPKRSERGSHLLRARARDASGNQAVSQDVQVTVR